MNEVITDAKVLFNEVKNYKNLGSQLTNMAPYFIVVPKNNRLFVYFPKDSRFYFVKGEILTESIFGKWCLETGKTAVYVKSEDFAQLSKVLKKNVVSISMTDKRFEFLYKNKEEEDCQFIAIEWPGDLNINTFVDTIEEKCTISKNIEINLSNEIFEYYFDNEKILEIPTKRILSLVKNFNNAEINFSEKDMSTNTRYIVLKTSSEFLMLEQVFKAVSFGTGNN